jgi:hypothetical protein
MQFFEHKRSIDHRILGQVLGDFAESDLICGRGELDTAMWFNDERLVGRQAYPADVC